MLLFLGLAAAYNTSLPAFNPLLTNSLLVGKTPELYYNGSGPVPAYNTTSPDPAPLLSLNTTDVEDAIYKEIVAITSTSQSNCTKCMMATEVMHIAALTQNARSISNILIRLCNKYKYSIYAASCEQEYLGVGNTGPYYAQLFRKMSMGTGDMQAYCHYQFSTCDAPPVIQIDESKYFSPKPANRSAPAPSGKSMNVLHLSDWHLDPRYDIGSEGACSQYLCCRPYSTNTKYNTTSANPYQPASRFGSLYCDAPADLALSVFKSLPTFQNVSDLAFSIFTGDIVSHDNNDQLSRAYVEYEEAITYNTFKQQLGNVPVYATLGNHDSLPEAWNTPNEGNTTNVFSWNYELLTGLWRDYNWISADAASYGRSHYAAYSTVTKQGLKIISLNTDFWYTSNIFNFYNFTNPDNSGNLQFLIDELTASEKINQRVWIIGHVLSGYSGTNALPNPSALFYSIVRRFSPSTIAAIFFGHTHEEQLQIFYDYASTSLNGTMRNTTDVDYNKPLMMGFIGPSVTPLTGNNAGYRILQVDSSTFEVTGGQTYYANMSNAATWPASGPVWQLEYDVRKVYANSTWPSSAPLNATFWDRVTYQMLANNSLVSTYNFYETKSSAVTKNCTSPACAQQKVCYIRSGSSALGQLCSQNNGPF